MEHLKSFAIKTSRLIIVPSFLLLENLAYRELYSSLHRMSDFTTMAFGAAWGVKDWDISTIYPIISREVERSWKVRGMGDFGVGLLPPLTAEQESSGKDWKVLEAHEVQLEQVQWIGYVGVRDATATSQPTTKPWTQMIELRYGFHPEHWGKGYGTEAATAVMGWCEQTLGAKRFIAETELENSGSARILGKLGFTAVDKEKEVIWGVEGEKEWDRWVGR